MNAVSTFGFAAGTKLRSSTNSCDSACRRRVPADASSGRAGSIAVADRRELRVAAAVVAAPRRCRGRPRWRRRRSAPVRPTTGFRPGRTRTRRSGGSAGTARSGRGRCLPGSGSAPSAPSGIFDAEREHLREGLLVGLDDRVARVDDVERDRSVVRVDGHLHRVAHVVERAVETARAAEAVGMQRL